VSLWRLPAAVGEAVNGRSDGGAPCSWLAIAKSWLPQCRRLPGGGECGWRAVFPRKTAEAHYLSLEFDRLGKVAGLGVGEGERVQEIRLRGPVRRGTAPLRYLDDSGSVTDLPLRTGRQQQATQLSFVGSDTRLSTGHSAARRLEDRLAD
jgi:hypothetical protein